MSTCGVQPDSLGLKPKKFEIFLSHKWKLACACLVYIFKNKGRMDTGLFEKIFIHSRI